MPEYPSVGMAYIMAAISFAVNKTDYDENVDRLLIYHSDSRG